MVSIVPVAVLILAPAPTCKLLILVLELIMGYLAMPPGITTSEVEEGFTLPDQLVAFSQSVLTLPVQVKVGSRVLATYVFSHTIAARSTPFSRTIYAPCAV